MNLWSERALPCVRNLLMSAIGPNLGLLEEAWDCLCGLGPGLTPAGDDLLVGFLAAHKLLCSPLGRCLSDHDLKISLTRKARATTGPVAAQFLSHALDGRFSEVLYAVLDGLLSQPRTDADETRVPPEEATTVEINDFLRWGHTSGTDTLAGIVFGLTSMLTPKDA
jgi:hypothetical protein